MPDVVIRVSGLCTRFGSNIVHDDLDLEVYRGEVMALVGGSGSGKSVLLQTILGLRRPAAGHIEVLGREVKGLDAAGIGAIQQRTGVLFQDGALFSSLTVAENIEVPLRAHTRLDPRLRAELAAVKLALVGLPPDTAYKYPSELSGGMRKRAGVARALALDPEILFLDEPTAGLDPIAAAEFDQLISELQSALELTVVMVTHDLDSLYAVCDRISVLVNRRVKVGTVEQLIGEPDPWIHSYFLGPRGRAAGTSKSARATGASFGPATKR